MPRINFVHGSSATPEKPENFEFELFDYTHHGSDKNDHENVNSGLDAEGPGIYAFGVLEGERFTTEQIGGARTGKVH